MIVGGGTGGHVFPGLAIADYLITRNWRVHWLGTNNHIEAILVPKHNITIDFIHINGLYNKKIKEQLIVLKDLFYAVIQARRIILTWKPDIVLGMGGYVSAPGGLAAWSCGIPLVLHEQNNVAGFTNRVLSKLAYKTLQAFPNTIHNAIAVGNPLRNILLDLPQPEDRFFKRSGPLRVLVIGGSQGASIFNQIMPSVATRLTDTLVIWHQVGNKNVLNEVKMAYLASNQTQHKIVEFIDDIAIAYTWADILICRAGALTVSEIAAIGVPSLLVPFMYHKDRQQYYNALTLEKVGAAIIVEQSQFTTDYICNILVKLDRNRLLTMAKNAKIIAIFDSTKRIYQEIATVNIAHNKLTLSNLLRLLH